MYERMTLMGFVVEPPEGSGPEHPYEFWLDVETPVDKTHHYHVWMQDPAHDPAKGGRPFEPGEFVSIETSRFDTTHRTQPDGSVQSYINVYADRITRHVAPIELGDDVFFEANKKPVAYYQHQALIAGGSAEPAHRRRRRQRGWQSEM